MLSGEKALPLVTPVLEIASRQGLDPERLAACLLAKGRVRVLPASVPIDRVFGLWAEVASAIGDVTVPFRAAPLLKLEQLEAPGFAVLTAPSGGAALERMLRYSVLIATAGVWQSAAEDDVIRMRWLRAGEPSLGMRLANESGLAQFVVCLRQVFGEGFAPARVSFRHRAPASTRAHRGFFRCPVDFEAAEDAFTFSRRTLEAVPPLANAALCAYLTERADAVLAARAAESFGARLSRAVEAELRRDEPELDGARLSRLLGVSERTLRRRLRTEGVALRKIVDTARRDAARRLLEETRAPITDVALRVGFSDSSAFAHAVQRWFGRSPRQIRRGRS